MHVIQYLFIDNIKIFKNVHFAALNVYSKDVEKPRESALRLLSIAFVTNLITGLVGSFTTDYDVISFLSMIGPASW